MYILPESNSFLEDLFGSYYPEVELDECDILRIGDTWVPIYKNGYPVWSSKGMNLSDLKPSLSVAPAKRTPRQSAEQKKSTVGTSVSSASHFPRVLVEAGLAARDTQVPVPAPVPRRRSNARMPRIVGHTRPASAASSGSRPILSYPFYIPYAYFDPSNPYGYSQ